MSNPKLTEADFRAVLADREFQEALTADVFQQSELRLQIFEALSKDAQEAVRSAEFAWSFDPRIGGMLTVHYRQFPPLLRSDRQLVLEFLDVVKYLTQIRHVVIVGGTFPLICRHENHSWRTEVLAGRRLP